MDPTASRKPQKKTIYDLLMTAPDDQVVRLKLAWQEAIAGHWKEAAAHLRNAAQEGDSTWHDECAVNAIELEAKNGVAHWCSRSKS